MKTKNRISNWLALLALLLAPVLAQAQYNYTVNPGGTTITITGYTGPAGAVNIPGTFAGYTVNNIGNTAFLSNSIVTSVTIPGSVTNIGDGAFDHCIALTNVTIPNGVTRLGVGAFASCSALTSVTIPDSVVFMGDLTFQACSSLSTATIGSGLKTVPYLAFTTCTNLSTVVIGSGVTNIAESAFVLCLRLKQVVIPFSVQSLGKGAFALTGLTNIVIPPSVLTIGESAFSGCGDLASTLIFPGVQSIGDLAFYGSGIEAIHLPASVTQLGQRNPFAACPNLIDITVDPSNPAYMSVFNADSEFKHYYALFDKTQTAVITLSPGYIWNSTNFIGAPSLPGSVTNIGAYAFTRGGALIQLPPNLAVIGEHAFSQNGSQQVFPQIFPSTVTTLDKLISIGDAAFEDCLSLDVVRLEQCPVLKIIGIQAFNGSGIKGSVVIPNSVTNLGVAAFDFCFGLQSLTVGTGIISIPELAFNFCVSLTNVSLPNGLISIGTKAFEGCQELPFIAIPNTVTTMGVSAFQRCTSLTGVTIPNSVNTIPPFAFAQCYSLTSVTIPNSVTMIQTSAFSECENLTSLTIPGSVTSLGDHAFELTKLSSVVIPNSVTYLGDYAFQACSNLTSVTIGNGVPVISAFSFVYCTSLTNVVIGTGVRDIGAQAFGVTKLNSITIPNNVTNIGASAFELCASLTNILIGTGVRDIGTNAFFRAGLRSITLPNNVINLRLGAFGNCSQLRDVTLSQNLTTIGNNAFQNCASLTSLTVPSSVSLFHSRVFLNCINLTNVSFTGAAPATGVGVFQGADNTTVYYPLGATGWNPPIATWQGRPAVPWDPPSKLLFSLSGGTATVTKFIGSNSVVNIPASLGGFPIRSIGAFAFAGSGVTSVTIPEGVFTIGDRSFQGCLGLTTLNLPDSLTSIAAGGLEGYSFASCANLASVTFGTNFSVIGNGVFSGCASLQSLYFRGTDVPANPPQNYFTPSTKVFYPIGGNAGTWSTRFADATVAPWDPSGNFLIQLNGVNITITGYAGAGGAASIPNVIGGFPVTAIAPNAFQNSTLTSIAIPESVTSIGDSAFFNCTSLTSVTMGNGVTNIGVQAFYQCTALNLINLGSSVTTIGDYAFSQCNLLNIFIPASVINMGANCFANTPLGSVYFKGNAPTVPGGVFNASAATLYYVPGSTGWGAIGAPFAGQPTALWSDVVPCRLVLSGGALTISTYVAINGGPGAAVNIPPVIGGYPVRNIGASAFPGVAIASITIPDSVQNIENSAFQGCFFLKDINLGNGVTNIGQNAFASSGLERLTLPASITSLSSTAFNSATLLNRIYFKGNAPSLDSSLFSGTSATLYYPLGTTGWGAIGSAFGGQPTGLWSPEVPCHIQFASGQVSIAQYIGSGGDLILPSVIGGYPVTKILAGAFNAAAITSLTIPASITNIEAGSIVNCLQLSEIYFKGNAPTFGLNAIMGTPTTLYYDPGTAGWGGPGVPGLPKGYWSVQIPSRLALVSGNFSVSDYLGSGGAVTIPASIGGFPVTKIGPSAFAGAALTSITLPDSVTRVEDYAFLQCYSLSSVNFGNALEYIGYAAFADCALVNITLPASFNILSDQAFILCESLQTVLFKGNAPSLGAFQSAFAATPATLYYDPSTSGWGAIGTPFSGRPTGLWSVQVPCFLSYDSGALSIGKYLGSGGVMNVPSAIAGYPVTSIRTNAFVFSAIQSLTVPDSVRSIGDYCFYGSSNLTSAFIGNGVTNIGKYAFAYCVALNSISVGNSVETIDASAFTSCAALTSITLPASLTSLGDLAFYNCGSLQRVFFKGNAPALGGGFVFDSTPATAYYLAGRTGWGPTLAGHPAVLWNPLLTTTGPGLGAQDDQFIFKVTGVANIPIAVEACTNLANPVWQQLFTGTLINGSMHYSDPAYLPTNPQRFYRISSP